MKIGNRMTLVSAVSHWAGQPETTAEEAGEYKVVAKCKSKYVGSPESRSTAYSLRNVADGTVHHAPDTVMEDWKARGIVQ